MWILIRGNMLIVILRINDQSSLKLLIWKKVISLHLVIIAIIFPVITVQLECSQCPLVEMESFYFSTFCWLSRVKLLFLTWCWMMNRSAQHLGITLPRVTITLLQHPAVLSSITWFLLNSLKYFKTVKCYTEKVLCVISNCKGNVTFFHRCVCVSFCE